MSKKKPRQPMPPDEAVTCYACRIEPAVVGILMKTPSGGDYWRGWCQGCNAGTKSASERRRDRLAAKAKTTIAKAPAAVDGQQGYRVGDTVRVSFVGTVITIWPNDQYDVYLDRMSYRTTGDVMSAADGEGDQP